MAEDYEYLTSILGQPWVKEEKEFNDSAAHEKLGHIYRCVMYRFLITIFAGYGRQDWAKHQHFFELILDWIIPKMYFPEMLSPHTYTTSWKESNSVLDPFKRSSNAQHINFEFAEFWQEGRLALFSNHIITYSSDFAFNPTMRIPIFSDMEKMQSRNLVLPSCVVEAVHLSHDRRHFQVLIKKDSGYRMMSMHQETPIFEWVDNDPNVRLNLQSHPTCPPLANPITMVCAWFSTDGSQLNLIHLRKPSQTALYNTIVWTKLQLKREAATAEESPTHISKKPKLTTTKERDLLTEKTCNLKMDPRNHTLKFGISSPHALNIVSGGPPWLQNLIAIPGKEEEETLRMWVQAEEEEGKRRYCIGYLWWGWHGNEQKWAQNPWCEQISIPKPLNLTPTRVCRSYFCLPSYRILLVLHESYENSDLFQLATSLEENMTTYLCNSCSLTPFDKSGLGEYWRDKLVDLYPYNLEWIFEINWEDKIQPMEKEDDIRDEEAPHGEWKLSIYHPIFDHIKIIHPVSISIPYRKCRRFSKIYNILQFSSFSFWLDFLSF